MPTDAVTLAWTSLLVAGIFEWGWPVGLKLGWTPEGKRLGWIAFSGACMLISGALLLYAQATIAIGTAYAVWTGIGSVGAFVLGVVVFREAATVARFVFVALIIAGIVGLKMLA
ncbi:MAG: SMR family transporter [Burkholderiales bacterium]|jgi:quaternary ammonium compound-resistance protein SugE